jgi:membrane-associated phospholipid phosphatase
VALNRRQAGTRPILSQSPYCLDIFLVTLISHQLGLDAGIIVALYGIAVLVGLTRIYVGVHYPRDVLGGARLGPVWGILAALVYAYWLTLSF